MRGAGIQVLVELADSVEEVTFEPGDSIFVRGERRGQTFFVLEGEAEGDRLDPEIRVLFGPGSLVGGVASLGEPILAWQARAVTRVRALAMRLDDSVSTSWRSTSTSCDRPSPRSRSSARPCSTTSRRRTARSTWATRSPGAAPH